MEFIKQVLGTIDITWNAICIIATPIFCYLFVMFVPVEMLFFFGVFAFYQVAQLLVAESGWDRAKLTIHLIVFVSVVVSLYLWCAHVVISDGLCRDISGFIPGTMDSWVQSLVPHTCPAQ